MEQEFENDKTLAIVLVSVILAASLLTALYCCLKNRGKICRKKEKRNPEALGQEESEVEVPGRGNGQDDSERNRL